MQFSVPQFIDIKEKIFGPLTLTQFIYLAAGGGFCFLLFQVLELGLFIVVAFPIVIVAVLLAFYKYNGMPFSDFLVALLKYFKRPRKRVWKRVVEIVKESQKTRKAKKMDATRIKELPDKSSLQKLSYVLDTEGGALLYNKGEKQPEEKIDPSKMTTEEKTKKTEELISGLY